MSATAGTVRGVAEVELRSGKFSKGAKEVESSIGRMERKVNSAWTTMGGNAENSANKAQQAGTKTKAAYVQMQQGANLATPAIKRTTEQINMAKLTALGAVTGYVALGASLAGLSASLVNIPKRITDVQKTLLDLSKTTLSLDREADNLRKQEVLYAQAMEDGTKSAAELMDMQKQLVFVRRNMDDIATDLIIKEEELIQKQDELNHSYLLTGSAVAMTVLSGGSAIILTLSTMATTAGITTGEFIKLRVATIANSRALAFMRPNIGRARTELTLLRGTLLTSGTAFSAVTGKVSLFNLSLKTLGHGFKALYFAMGPPGIALVAITTALQAFEENWGGFRDALSWLTRTELPSFSEALEDTAGKTRRLNDDLQAIGDQFGLSSSQVYELKEMTKLYNEELDKQLEAQAAIDLDKFAKANNFSAEETRNFTEAIKEMAAENDRLKESVDETGESIGGLGEAMGSAAPNARSLASEMTGAVTAMSGGAAAATGMHDAIKTMYADLEGASSLQLDVDMTMLTDSLEHVSHNFEAYTGQWNLALDGMKPHILSTRETFNTSWGDGAFVRHIQELRKYGRISEEVFSEINAMIEKTGASMDKLGQKKTTLETDLRGLVGTERILTHLGNVRIRALKGQEFYRDNVVNGGGDSIQQAKNYYNSHVANKGQNQLDMGNWRSVDSGKPGFSPTKWVQNQGGNLKERRRREAHERALARSVGIAENLGWSYRRRGGRENVVRYFRGKQASAFGYVRETKRRAAALGVEAGRGVHGRFDREVDAFTESTGLDRRTVRNWRYTTQGYNDLVSVSAYQQRLLIEASS